MNPNDLRYGHFWSKLPEEAALTSRLPKVIIDAEFEEDLPILGEADVLEYIYEDTGIDYTGVKVQDEGIHHVSSMGSNSRTTRATR